MAKVEPDSCGDLNKGTLLAEGSAISTVFWVFCWIGAHPEYVRLELRTRRITAAGFNRSTQLTDPSSGSKVYTIRDRSRHYSRYAVRCVRANHMTFRFGFTPLMFSMSCTIPLCLKSKQKRLNIENFPSCVDSHLHLWCKEVQAEGPAHAAR